MRPALLTVFCGLLLSVSAFSNDILLPSLFAIQAEFGTSIENVQLVVPVFMLVSALGQLVFGAGSDRFGRRHAIIAGLTSLSHGAADLYHYGEVNQIIIEMIEGYLFVMAVDDGSTVGVLADSDCDVGSVGYEMTLLIQRVGEMLTPALVEELKNVLSLRSSAT